MKKSRNQKGFTLIELVMIIVILGILAATAIIKYIDLQADAELAACKGIYGSMASAYAITIAEHRTDPTIAQVNANINGTAGDMVVNGDLNHGIAFNGVSDNHILGTYWDCQFDVTFTGANMTSIGNLNTTAL
jgi:MSHA pilin protein MshA